MEDQLRRDELEYQRALTSGRISVTTKDPMNHCGLGLAYSPGVPIKDDKAR
jgi:hypothetical protein